MSNKSIMEAYERSMKKDPSFRDTTSQIEQPTPYDEKKPKPKTHRNIGSQLTPEEEAYIKEVDRRMAINDNQKNTPQSSDRIIKLEKRVETLEKALKMVMENHKKLVRRL